MSKIGDILKIEEYKKIIDEYKAKVDMLEKAVQALLKAQVEMESDTGNEYMPQGEYYGHRFE